MLAPSFRWIALLGLAAAVSGHAGTLTVTTDQDERNCRSEAGCTTLPNSGGTQFPDSTGCSLREALDDIQAAANGLAQPYPECGAADGGASPAVGYLNTIVLGAHTINVNSQVPDPGIDLATNPPCASMAPVKCPIQYGELTHIGDSTASIGYGNLSITGGTLTCTDSNMVHVNPTGDLTLSGTHFQNCTTAGSGVAITDQNDASLALNGVTFLNIHSTSDSVGGCIQHGSGNLVITGASFTGCIVDNGSGSGAYPFGGGTNGTGGAINIGNVGSAQHVLISGATFQGNVASLKGGAIYMSGTDAITIDTSTFQANLAFGDASSNPQNGGGAIYAEQTATGAIPSPPPVGFNASDFLLFQDNFAANLAINGNGGAILLYSGNLTYGAASFTLTQGVSLAGKVPGGIIASNFSANQAQGAANASDSRSGSGGAIYAESAQLAILDSSFVGGNASSNASGGAIAYMDATDSRPPIAISNTTFNGNSAAVNGGAIANLLYTGTGKSGKIALINDTLSGNTTTAAGGGGNLFNGNTTAADVTASNTIFDGGAASGNCAGNPFTDVVGNLQFNPNAGCGTMTAADPMLKSASIFSGPNILVFTMDLNAGSAASGSGDPATCAASPIQNLDGAVNGRPSGKPNCDIGAYESGIVPDLTVNKTHTDPFISPSSGDTYTITANNIGNDSTSGTVAVADSLPAGLTATAMSGSGWSCTLGTLTCMRSDALAAGSSYPPITLTVDANAGLSGTIVNSAAVSGGAEANTGNDSANDPTTVQPPPDLTIAKTHSGNFTKGQVGATFTITVSNIGSGPTSGMVSVVDNLPAGLTATAISGTGWSCVLATLTCTRSDVLAAAPAAYPPITVTVDVAANPPAQVINSADVSGGSDGNISNNHADDGTTLPVRLQSFKVD